MSSVNCGLLVLCSWICAAYAEQDPAPPAEATPSSQATSKNKVEHAPIIAKLSYPMKLDGLVEELPAWSNKTVELDNEILIPVVVGPCSTVEEVMERLENAICPTLEKYLINQGVNSAELKRHGSIPETARFCYSGSEFPTVTRKRVEGRDEFRAAVLLRLLTVSRDGILGAIRAERHQLAAARQTLFLGGGFIAFVAILAFYSKLNHATNGNRVGILRATTAIAILCLLGGFITVAALSGIFTA